jgi:cell division protein ZapA (FtsZ GTPase activity inhibitor)
MISQPKKYKISILGESYSIVTDETEEHIVRAASLVDTYMQEIAQKLGSGDIKKLAVLAGLQSSSKLLHSEIMLAQERERYSRLETLLKVINLDELAEEHNI